MMKEYIYSGNTKGKALLGVGLSVSFHPFSSPALSSSCNAPLSFLFTSPAPLSSDLVRSEAGLIRYLGALKALGGSPHLKVLHPITSIRLQVRDIGRRALAISLSPWRSALVSSVWWSCRPPQPSFAVQSELYSLTSPGGPHYAPRAVRVRV